ncbi:hypothetical protein [Candidatus Palauibacter sp.]|uniref:hypothetical protein n=1 Tax=Candidatus Palauibacter sp. TaxID=3101350 RepID=UPI003B02EAE2
MRSITRSYTRIFPDLSAADFELRGNGDVNNPDVPDLPEIGLRSWFHGHGLLFYVGHVLFIAERLDPAALERTVWSLPSGGCPRWCGFQPLL